MAQRAPAKVNVSLLSSVNVKVSNNITVKDYYKSIFSNSINYTSDPAEYSASLIPNNSEKNKDNNKTPVTPKYLVSATQPGNPSLILLGDAIICKPSTPNFATDWLNLFRATLPNYGINILATSNWKNGAGPGWMDGIGNGTNINFSYPRSGNTLGGQVQQFSGNLPNGTATTNVWIPSTEGNGQNNNSICGFKEVNTAGIYKYRQDGGGQLNSAFKLNVNQPFSIKYLINQLSPELTYVESGSSSEDTNDTQGRLIITWGSGNYSLQIFSDNSIKLLVNNVQIGDTQKIPVTSDINQMRQITVYPLGNFIYVYGGIPSTNHTINRRYVAFDLKKAANIPSSTVNANFDCGSAYFDFSPVIHYTSGSITSPLIGVGAAVASNVFQCSYIGKFGVGTRPNPITFPDQNDTTKLYSYYSLYSITANVNLQQTNVYTYTLSLNVPTNVNSNAINAQVQAAHQAVVQAFQSNIAGMQAGTTTQAQAVANTNTAINTFNNTFTNAMSSAFSTNGLSSAGNQSIFGIQFANGTGGSAGADAVYQTAQNAFGFFGSTPSASPSGAVFSNDYLTNVINSIFGTGGQMDSVSKHLAQTVASAAIAAVQSNIYSPAVFLSQLTLIVASQNVDLAPNPQIDNCDVMSISINQAVEQNKGTIVLNNRNACDKTGVSKGKYTWIKGQNNFCGVKPIQVQLGYADNAGLNTVFTGFIADRQYSRDSSNSSICTLELEDATKMLRESFAVNLPYFDGWCNLGVIYYLAKEAGFTDDQILLDQNPVDGTGKVRIRDLLTGNPDTFTGGCFEGHLNDNPPGGFGLGGDYLHMTLPLAIAGPESPNYNFNFGTSLWDCMQRIREFSNFYLYANNFGNILYTPPKQALKQSNKTFVEVDTVGAFNEIKKRLDVDLNTAELRNGVIVAGITFLPNKDGIVGGEWSTHFHKQMIAGFPTDIGDAAFAPWRKIIFLRNPKWEDPNLARLACSELLRRVTRQRVTSAFDAWGQKDLFPYHLISIDESLTNETGAGLNNPYVVASHTISANTQDWLLNSSINVESFDSAAANYDPNLSSVRE